MPRANRPSRPAGRLAEGQSTRGPLLLLLPPLDVAVVSCATEVAAVSRGEAGALGAAKTGWSLEEMVTVDGTAAGLA